MSVLKFKDPQTNEWKEIITISGKTPEKGVDYWTDADKQEIINSVLAELPNGEEVNY